MLKDNKSPIRTNVKLNTSDEKIARELFESYKKIASNEDLWNEKFRSGDQKLEVFSDFPYDQRLEILLISFPIPFYWVAPYYRAVLTTGDHCDHNHETEEGAEECLEALVDKTGEDGVVCIGHGAFLKPLKDANILKSR